MLHSRDRLADGCPFDSTANAADVIRVEACIPWPQPRLSLLLKPPGGIQRTPTLSLLFWRESTGSSAIRLRGTTLMSPRGATVVHRVFGYVLHERRHASRARISYPYGLLRHAKGNKDKAPCLREI